MAPAGRIPTSQAYPTERRFLILVRHAAPELQPERPSSQWRLSEVGRAQCQPLSAELARYLPATLLSSREPKAAQTAALLADFWGLEAIQHEGLHEQRRENTPFFATRAAFMEAVVQIFRQPDEIVFGTESGRQALLRFDAAIQQILAAYPDGNVIVVAHGTVIALFLAHYTGLDAEQFWRGFRLAGHVVLEIPGFGLVAP